MSGFVELCTTTNFSFLRAASHPEEFVEQANKRLAAINAAYDRIEKERNLK